MNSRIQAERLAKATQAIGEEVRRLGGSLEVPTGRAPDPATRHVLTLEAIVEALRGVETPTATEETPAKPAAKGKAKA